MKWDGISSREPDSLRKVYVCMAKDHSGNKSIICVRSNEEAAKTWVNTNTNLIDSDQIDYYSNVYYLEIAVTA